MKGLTHYMNGHCNKIRWSYFTPEVYKLYQCDMPSTAEANNLLLIIQNLIFLEINILAKTYSVILRNIIQLCQVRQKGVGEGCEPPRHRLLAFMNTYPAIKRH